MAAGVVAHRALLVGRQRRQVLEHILDRACRPTRCPRARRWPCPRTPGDACRGGSASSARRCAARARCSHKAGRVLSTPYLLLPGGFEVRLNRLALAYPPVTEIDGMRVLVAGGAHRVGRAIALDLADARRRRGRSATTRPTRPRRDGGNDRGAGTALRRTCGRRHRDRGDGGAGGVGGGRARRTGCLRPLPLRRIRAGAARGRRREAVGLRRSTPRPRASSSPPRPPASGCCPAGA